MINTSYKLKYAAFLDLLGFKNMVYQSVENQNILNNINMALSYIGKSLFKIFPMFQNFVIIKGKNRKEALPCIIITQVTSVGNSLKSYDRIWEHAKKKTKPRRTDLYDVFCVILYVLKGGIQWRMLPSDFPKWELVYYYFQVWSKEEDGTSLLDRVLKKMDTHATQ